MKKIICSLLCVILTVSTLPALASGSANLALRVDKTYYEVGDVLTVTVYLDRASVKNYISSNIVFSYDSAHIVPVDANGNITENLSKAFTSLLPGEFSTYVSSLDSRDCQVSVVTALDVTQDKYSAKSGGYRYARSRLDLFTMRFRVVALGDTGIKAVKAQAFLDSGSTPAEIAAGDFSLTLHREATDEDIFNAALSLWSEYGFSGGYLEGDIELPASIGEASITWKSSDEELLSPSGKYNAASSGEKVLLTATVAYGGYEKSFNYLFAKPDDLTNVIDSDMLIFYYDFDAGATEDGLIPDLSGNGFDAKVINQSGEMTFDGGVAHFPGLIDSSRLGAHLLLPKGVLEASDASFTISMWAKQDDSYAQRNGLIRFFDFGCGSIYNSIFFRTQGNSFSLRDRGGNVWGRDTSSDGSFSGSPFKDKWDLLTVVVNIETQRATIYVDGEVAYYSDARWGEKNSLANIAAADDGSDVSHVYIGTTVWAQERGDYNSQLGTDPDFCGEMDDIRLYGRALTEDEVKTLYAETAPGGGKEFSEAVVTVNYLDRESGETVRGGESFTAKIGETVYAGGDYKERFDVQNGWYTYDESSVDHVTVEASGENVINLYYVLHAVDSDNLITNGDFSSGLTDWTNIYGNEPVLWRVEENSEYSYDGESPAALLESGNHGSSDSTLRRVLDLEVGEYYLSYYVYNTTEQNVGGWGGDFVFAYGENTNGGFNGPGSGRMVYYDTAIYGGQNAWGASSSNDHVGNKTQILSDYAPGLNHIEHYFTVPDGADGIMLMHEAWTADNALWYSNFELHEIVNHLPEAKITDISVTPPEKVLYDAKDAEDYTGLTVTAYYDDGTNRIVSGFTVGEIDFTRRGVQSIAVSFAGFAASFDVFVIEGDLFADISIDKMASIGRDVIFDLSVPIYSARPVENANLILAIYSGSELWDVYINGVSIGEGSNSFRFDEVRLSDPPVGEYEIRAFIWDGDITLLLPLAKAAKPNI